MSLSQSGWVTVAVLGKTHGNRGEISALPLSSKPERYQNLWKVHLFHAGTSGEDSRAPSEPPGERAEIEFAWFHERTLILKFRGVDTISAAERLSGAEVRIPQSERIALGPDEFFQSDLIGCEVIDRNSGKSLGCVTDWDESGGAGLLVLDNGMLIPFAHSICTGIYPEKKRIEVILPEGLKDLNS